MATFDPNAWYGVSEHRVDNVSSSRLGGGLQGKGDTLNVFSRNNQDWQLQPVDGVAGRYLLRTNTQGPGMQLSSCYKASEIHPAKTGVCLRPTTSDDAQKWDITDWGDGTFRITNVANGTGFWVDVHPLAALFMNNETESSSVPQPAQHWIFTSDKPVNDGAYSTIYSAPSMATGTSTASITGTSSGSQSTTTTETGTASGAGTPTTSNPPQNGTGSAGLSSGAAAGIGVGATLAVLGLVAFAWFCFWRRRRRNQPQSTVVPAETATQQMKYKPDGWDHGWSQSPPPAPVYSQTVYHEVQGPVWQSELPGSPPGDSYYPTISPSPAQFTQSTVSLSQAHQPPSPQLSHAQIPHANG